MRFHPTHSAVEGASARMLCISLLICTALIEVGCGEKAPPPDAQQVRNGPGPGDSLARLIRAMLAAPDPMGPYKAMICENKRLVAQYGSKEAEEIRQQVMDTIYSPSDGPARRRVEERLAHNVIINECQ